MNIWDEYFEREQRPSHRLFMKLFDLFNYPIFDSTQL
jgi:hypothetical protein